MAHDTMVAERAGARLANLAVLTELVVRPQWVVYRIEHRRGKPKADKVPYTPGTTARAATDDPKTWRPFSEAHAAYTRGGWHGVGFVFSAEAGVIGIDLDGVRRTDTGAILPEALAIVQALDTYTEISQSGEGLHILALGTMPDTGRAKAGYFGPDTKLEMYAAGRFFALTGELLNGAPLAVNDRSEAVDTLYRHAFAKAPAAACPTRPGLSLSDQRIIERARAAKNGAKFEALWNGDTRAYGGDDSAADMALCSTLAFWTQDAQQIDRLFRQSGLYRPKWDDRRGASTYGQRTIEKALADCRATYSGQAVDSENPPSHTPGSLPVRLGARISSTMAAAIVQRAPQAIAPELARAVLDALLQPKTEALLRRKAAGESLLAWMDAHGGFACGQDGEPYYYSRTEARLFNLNTERAAAWLYAITGINPASTDFAYLLADCKTRALRSPVRDVVRVAAWNGAQGLLRVSAFNGSVYVLDGEHITTEPNGQAVIFDDDPLWQPYTLDDGNPGALRWLTDDVPNWQPGRRERHGLAFRALILSTFFSELCPSKPLTVFLGEKGSGKSTALRLWLRLMFGPRAELAGVPDRPDGFTAAAGSQHLLFLDNLDSFTTWLRDKLARISTGAEDTYRRLYTSNDPGRVIYRCWLAFTARTPDTLRRDDLADRLLILPVDRIGDDRRQRENELFGMAEAWRGRWWGDVLTACNAIVAAIRRGEIASRSALRLADWEAVGRLVARAEGHEPLWDAVCHEVQRAQGAFLLEDDAIVEALSRWLRNNPKNAGRAVTARELYAELTTAMYGDKRPDEDWPKSARAFGKRLATMRRELQTMFDLRWDQGTELDQRSRLVYTIQRFRDSEAESQLFSNTNTPESLRKLYGNTPVISESLNQASPPSVEVATA